MKPWEKNGKLIENEDGKPIECDECPCAPVPTCQFPYPYPPPEGSYPSSDLPGTITLQFWDMSLEAYFPVEMLLVGEYIYEGSYDGATMTIVPQDPDGGLEWDLKQDGSVAGSAPCLIDGGIETPWFPSLHYTEL